MPKLSVKKIRKSDEKRACITFRYFTENAFLRNNDSSVNDVGTCLSVLKLFWFERQLEKPNFMSVSLHKHPFKNLPQCKYLLQRLLEKWNGRTFAQMWCNWLNKFWTLEILDHNCNYNNYNNNYVWIWIIKYIFDWKHYNWL